MHSSVSLSSVSEISSKITNWPWMGAGFSAGAALVLLGAGWLAAPGGTGFLFPLDDAYIVLHNARVLLSGGADPNYVGIDPLVGSTSPVHLALVSAFGLFLPLVSAASLVAALGIAAYAAGLVAMARRSGAGLLPSMLFAAAGLLVARTPHQLLNGLETGLAMATVAWLLVLVADPAPGRTSRIALWTLAGLAPFVRPELALLAAPACAVDLARVARRGRRPTDVLATLRPALVGAVVAALPFLLWTLLATGTPIPGTASAKRAWFAEAGLPTALAALSVLSTFALFAIQFGGIALAGLLRIGRTPIGRLGAGFVLVLLAIFAATLPGGPSHNDYRYLYIAAPVLLFAAAAPFAGGHHTFPGPLQRSVVYAAALLATALATAPMFWSDYRAALAVTGEGLVGIAERARLTLPDEARLLVHDAGYVAWATPFRLTDMVGLKTPSSIAEHRTLTEPSGGVRRGEALDAIARRAGATHAVVHQGWDALFGIVSGLEARGWRVDPLGPAAGPYRLYSLAAPVSGQAAIDDSAGLSGSRGAPIARPAGSP